MTPAYPLPSLAIRAATLSVFALTLLTACSSASDSTTEPPRADTPPSANTQLTALGLGTVSNRFTAELWVRGTTAYTTTWGNRSGAQGNAINIWNVSGAAPTLVDSVIVSNANTLGDVQVSDDGSLLVVAIESAPNGGIAVFSLVNPRAPQLLVRTTGGQLANGVHTAEVARVNGIIHVFCAVDEGNGLPSRLVILSLATPASPQVVFSQGMGNPFLHDVFVRDGLMFTSEWNDGTNIWDIGAQGGTLATARRISRATTFNGRAHNSWWFHDPTNNNRKYLFVSDEGPGTIGSESSGDVHVVDISDLSTPVQVARYRVPNAGAHNISIDEANGLLYVAFYNGGVRVLDIRGDLATCTAAQRTVIDNRCDLGLMGREVNRFTGTGNPVYVWGVHQSASGVFASDMLNGLWRITPHTR